jgi:hypothetical protein
MRNGGFVHRARADLCGDYVWVSAVTVNSASVQLLRNPLDIPYRLVLKMRIIVDVLGVPYASK